MKLFQYDGNSSGAVAQHTPHCDMRELVARSSQLRSDDPKGHALAFACHSETDCRLLVGIGNQLAIRSGGKPEGSGAPR
jgi:hypothetical protein